MKEFELIEFYFAQADLAWSNQHVNLGIGDDCAIMNFSSHHQLCVSIDTLVEDVHFPKHATPYDIATRALCVSLSDLAAMAATPVAFTLAITLPDANPQWLKSFTDGLIHVAKKYNCPLIGGDTTRGPNLIITLQVHGIVETGKALTRSQAKVGDKVYVSGDLGDGAGALPMVLAAPQLNTGLAKQYYYPYPKIEFAQAIQSHANSCLDISDGLIQDLNHICKRSSVGMVIDIERIPMSSELLSTYNRQTALQYALTGGDDYQIAYTAANCLLGMCIGEVVAGDCVSTPGFKLPQQGFQHF